MLLFMLLRVIASRSVLMALLVFIAIMMTNTARSTPPTATNCDPDTQTPTAYAQCLNTYRVTEEVLASPDCTTIQLPNKPAGITQPLGGINLGVCLFHRVDTKEQNQRAIEVLQQAQLVGLSPNHTAVAQLLEGLLHCRQARHYRQDLLDAKTPTAAGRWGQDLFCMERRLGTTAITDLAWEYAVIHYDSDIAHADLIAQPEYTHRLKELEACYDKQQNGPFHPDFATQCREDAANNETTVRKLATAEARELVAAYLTSGNPFSAMFSRKENMVTGVKTRSEAKIAALAKDVAQLRALYNQQAQLLDSQKSRVDPLITRYESALHLGYNIMDNYERWVKQFWLHPTEGDLKGPLQSTCQNLASQNANIQEAKNIPNRPNCQGIADPGATIKVTDLTALEGLLDIIKSTATQADTQQAAVKSMCQLYFCHLLAKPLQSITHRVCKSRIFKAKNPDNPLCNFSFNGAVQGIITNPNDKAVSSSVVEICRSAGLPAQFLTAGLPQDQRAACFAKH